MFLTFVSLFLSSVGHSRKDKCIPNFVLENLFMETDANGVATGIAMWFNVTTGNKENECYRLLFCFWCSLPLPSPLICRILWVSSFYSVGLVFFSSLRVLSPSPLLLLSFSFATLTSCPLPLDATIDPALTTTAAATTPPLVVTTAPPTTNVNSTLPVRRDRPIKNRKRDKRERFWALTLFLWQPTSYQPSNITADPNAVRDKHT